MTDDTTDQPASLETRIERIENMLSQLLTAGSRPAAPAAEDGGAGRPPTVEEQVRAELQRAAEEQSKAQADAAAAVEAETLAERLARLEEKAPVPPQPRRQKAMWGPR